MKLKISAKELQKALAIVAPAISNSVVPINKCVLIQVTETECTFTGTNSNLAIETVADIIKVDNGVEMCVDFQELRAIASRLTGDAVIEDLNGEIVIICGGRKWKSGKSEDVKNFSRGKPFTPDWSTPLPADALYYMEKALLFTEPKSSLTRWQEVWINIYDEKLDIASADGNIAMFRYQASAECGIKFKGIVHPSFVKAASKIEGHSYLQSNGTAVRVQNDKTTVTISLSEDLFPAYESFYNKNWDYNIEINRGDFLAAVEDMFVYTPVSTAPVITKLLFPKGGVSVTFTQPETNKDYDTTVKADHSLQLDKMYLVAAKLKNILSVFPSTTEVVKLSIEPTRTVFIKSDEDPLTLGINPLAYNN